MATAVIPTALSTAFFIASLLSPTLASSPATPLTQVIPVDNFVGHIVQKDESLSQIAAEYYGDEAYWTTIWNDNPLIKDPNVIAVDTLFRIRSQKPDKPEELREDLKEQLASIKSDSYSLSAGEPHPDPLLKGEGVQVTESVATPTPISSFDDVYKAAGAKFGVPWQILYGIHETETGARDGHIVSGYGTGAEGPMQFMPGTFHAYAVDGDGDGKADIDNAVDAIYTAANFLKQHGDLMNGLHYYGGNIAGTLSLAKARGFTL